MIPIPAWSRYRKIRGVGAGGSGQVFLVATTDPHDIDRRTAEPNHYVVKRIYVGDDQDEQRLLAATEVRVLQVLPTHPNVVAFHDHHLDDEGYFNIVIEHCSHGDLEKLINTRSAAGRPLPLKSVVWLTFQLLCGVRHLHRHHILHRDLKPGNIFLVPGAPTLFADLDEEPGDASACSPLSATNDDLNEVTLKIADFGISKVTKTGSYAQTVVGTPFYIPPEICESKPYTSAADMWAVGCIIFELCTLRRLFAGDNMLAVIRAISACNIPQLPAEYASLQPLVEALVAPDAALRPTADSVIRQYFPVPSSRSSPGIPPPPRAAATFAVPSTALGDLLSPGQEL
jgi:NIMA (never in mitosis gene a)-related kinase